MRNHLEQLIKILEHMNTLYDEMLVLLQREKQAALASDIELLVSATDEKRRLLTKIKAAEQSRVDALKQTTARLKLPAGRIRLKILAEQVDPLFGRELIRLNDLLRQKTKQVSKANKESRAFFQHGLNLIHNSLSFFNFWAEGTAVYGCTGLLQSGKTGKRLLSNTA
jgi:hypothetical protein